MRRDILDSNIEETESSSNVDDAWFAA